MTKLAEILNVSQEQLNTLDEQMKEAGFSALGVPAAGGEPALEKVERENEELIERALRELGVESASSADKVREALMKKAEESDAELYKFLGIDPENFDFQKVADSAREIATESKGWFLKKEFGQQILREREPEALLDYLGYTSTEELLEKEDITDIFSALRFTESQEWMHKTFDVAYTKFTADDFEHRPIEIKVLGPQWEEVAKKYVAKKHHNVSHLKEFGVIFLNPIAQSGKGKFVRDFALLLHYFHEIAFYSKLFQKYAKQRRDSPSFCRGGTVPPPAFNERFISLLRGDIREASEVGPGEWLLVQRYLWKEDPKEPRLFIPHVNPESMHWRKAEQDIVAFGRKHEQVHLEFWDKLWAVAGFFPSASSGQVRELVSFDLEDNAMMVAHKAEGKEQFLTYHQHEAMWNWLFAAYVGGYEAVEKHILEHMEYGIISLKKGSAT